MWPRLIILSVVFFSQYVCVCVHGIHLVSVIVCMFTLTKLIKIKFWVSYTRSDKMRWIVSTMYTQSVRTRKSATCYYNQMYLTMFTLHYQFCSSPFNHSEYVPPSLFYRFEFYVLLLVTFVTCDLLVSLPTLCTTLYRIVPLFVSPQMSVFSLFLSF